MTEVSPSNYWIASNALYITLNANGAPNYIQGNTASGAHILCYVKGVDGLEYDAAHNYRRWPLSLTPTKFNTNTEKYVYVAIPRPNTPDNTAVVVFPSEKLDLYGKNEDGQQIGSDLYYYVWLQGIITATNAGETLDREWQQRVDTGILSSDEAIDAGDNQTWWHYSSVDDAVTFLKEIWLDSQSFFHNLKAKILILAGRELNGVATADTGDEYVDSETLVVTPSYLKSKTEDKFLRKDQDDATPYSLGVGGDLNVGGIFRAITGYITSLFTDLVQSSNYTGDGIGDTGFRLTSDDGSGSSSMVVDNLHVRKKATFEEVEVKKETAVAGNEVRSAAANVINRTDYIDAQGEVIGYSVVHVPWVIRKMPLLLQNMFYARMRRLRIVIDSEDVQYIAKVRCYFLAKDGDRDVQNLWQAHDLARCQTFNLTQSKRLTYISSDTQTKLGNIYWWRKVVGVSTQTENIDGKDYHYFDVSMTDCDANSDIPAAGDHVVQFGNDSDEQRMNLIVQEVNGTDAPSVKAYMGIYTYNLNKCWWGGSPRKMMLSPKSGYEFYGPSFKFIQEYGQAPASIDRGVWTEITPERDDYAPHDRVRKLYYYDKVSHNGCYWLCVMTNVGAHWVADIEFTETVGGTTYTFSAGDYIPNDVYNVLVTNKTNCSRKENYTTDIPSESSTNWKKLVDSGDNMVRLDIDNEMDAVQTDSTGKVTAQHTITTTVRLYDGATEVAINNPTVSGISYTDAQGQQQTLNPTITASGNGKQLSWTFQAGWTLQARYQVNISYTYLDVPYNAVFTITASQGMAIFQLKPSLSAIAFQRDGNNQLTPASKTLGLNIVKIDGGSTADITPATYGVAKIRYSLTEMPALVSSGTAWPSVGDVPVPNTAENVYIALFNAYDILIDRETVPVIKDGEKGASITKASPDTYRYATNNTGVRPAADSQDWSTTKPTLLDGYWLYTETTIHWSDGSTTVLYSDERNPNDGQAGMDIVAGTTVMTYALTRTNVQPADSDFDSYPSVLTQGWYLWSRAETPYYKDHVGGASAGSSVVYNVSYVAEDGNPGRGITSITEYYKATANASDETAPADGQEAANGWSTNPNTAMQNWNQTNKYLWNYEKVTYSWGNPDISTPSVLAIWTKDGAAGRGIDSITNYYKVTNSATAPSKPSTPGTDGWSTSPTAPGQGQFLWNYEVITWVNGTPVTTETDVQMIGYAGSDGNGIVSITTTYARSNQGTTASETTAPTIDGSWSSSMPTLTETYKYMWRKEETVYTDTSKNTTKYYLAAVRGENGNNGKDGWMVTANPANVIITQSLGTNTSSFSSVMVGFTAKKGSVPATISSIDTPESSQFNVAKGTGDNIKKVVVSSPQTHGNPAEFYTEGTFVVNVNVIDPDTNTTVIFPITVPCYANLLGTWKQSVVDGEEQIAANKIIYTFGASGNNLATIQTDYASKRSSVGDFETFKSNYESGGLSINNINTRVSTAVGNINTVQRNAVTRNLLGRGQWKSSDYLGTLASYDAKNDRWYDDEANDLYSPTISLQKGTYCFYCYVPSNRYFSSKICIYKLKDGSMIIVYPYYFGVIDNDTVTINGNVYHRCYAQFELDEDINYVINVYGDSVDEADIAVPCLCEGDTPSIETSMSITRHTADNIELKVKECGINIDDKEIDLTAGKVNFKMPGGGTNSKISIDPTTGTLHAVDGDFSGSVSVGNGGLTCSVNNGKQTIVFEETARGANEIWYGFAATSVVDDLYSGDILSLGGRINTTTGAGYGRLLLEEVAVGNTEPVVLYETELLPGGCIFRKDSTGKTLEFGFFDGYGDRLWIHAPKAQWREYSSGLRDGVVYVDTQYGILRVSGYNDSSLPWGGGGGGTVTSITAGTGLSGGTITGSGTISISSTYQTYISNGNTAYGWGDHRQAGYLTSVAFSNLTSHPTSISGYGITDAYISGGTIHLGNNSITPLSNDMGQNYLYFTNGAYLKYTLNDRDSVLDIACQDNIHIDSGANVTIEADSDINIESDNHVNITGSDAINITGYDAINITSTTDEIRLNASAGVYVTGFLEAYDNIILDPASNDESHRLQIYSTYSYYVSLYADQDGLKINCSHANSNQFNVSASESYFDGDCYADSFQQSSDIRRKNIISDVNINIYNVANAPIFKFTWKDGKDNQALHVGTSAQYWKTVLPETVSEKKDGMLAMQYDVVALAAAVITAKTVASHEDRITILERENNALKNRIKELENTIFIN